MNKKGMTLVELICAISIISVVVILLFQLIITLQNNQNEKDEKNKLSLTIAMITREIQKDLESFGLASDPYTTDNETNFSMNNCTFGIDEITSNIVPVNSTNTYCLKLDYNQNNGKENSAYILYYIKNNRAYLAYKRGSGNIMETQIVREVSIKPIGGVNFEFNKESYDNITSYSIKLPLGKEESGYSMNINYISGL